MKAIFVVCLLGLAGVTLAAPDKYTSKYDTIDLKQILSNRRLLVPYLLCILDQGKCTPEGKELRSHIQEAIETDCAKCTEAQRSGTDEVIGHLVVEEPEYWGELTAKFDPTGRYVKAHEAELTRLRKSG
uniref:Chemosensory protein 5-like protein n=1 Tax=Antheraea pernyi TaxID=7119 RepID=A0AAU6R561_ANTPE